MNPVRLAEIRATLLAIPKEEGVTVISAPGWHEKHERKLNLLHLAVELLSELERIQGALLDRIEASERRVEVEYSPGHGVSRDAVLDSASIIAPVKGWPPQRGLASAQTAQGVTGDLAAHEAAAYGPGRHVGDEITGKHEIPAALIAKSRRPKAKPKKKASKR